jgi:GT2 family glycosyltransferase
MIRRDVFHKIGGFDENIWSGYGDVDFCLRAIKNGYFNVVTPLAKLIHYERATRAQLSNSAEVGDVRIFFAKHKDFLSEPDPFASDLLYIKEKENLLMRYYGYGGVGGYTNI